MPGSSEVNAINRQKFLAELAKLMTFMYEEDRRYALDMYERMFDIAEGNEQWLIQNLMSPTRQAVIIARAYDAKERKLSVEAEWRKDGEEDQNGEPPPFVLAINKIFDDLFPEDEETEETEESDADQVSFFDQNESRKETKKHRMPKAAVLLNRTQEFESVTAEAVEEIDLESILKKRDRRISGQAGQIRTRSPIRRQNRIPGCRLSTGQSFMNRQKIRQMPEREKPLLRRKQIRKTRLTVNRRQVSRLTSRKPKPWTKS